MHFPYRKSFHGIYKNIVDEKGPEQIHISVSGIFQDRNPSSIIDYESNSSFTSLPDSQGVNWIQIETLDRYFDITSYEIKSPVFNYPRKWEIYISLDGCKWALIDNPKDCDALKNIDGSKFSINKRYGYARYLKFINFETYDDSTNEHSIYMTNFEIYGSIYKCRNCDFFPPLIFSKCQHINFRIWNPFIIFQLSL